MKRGKVESILLIAVLALSMQVESYSVAISDRELDQYYAKNIQQKSTDVIVWKYRVWNGKKQKRRWNKTKTDGKIQHGKTYDELMQWKRYQI